MTPREKINLLLTEGEKVWCDESNKNFQVGYNIPPYYDEEKFKRGQQFYRQHIFSMFFAKLMGLLATLCVPTILKILMFTDMSETPYKAYKRYVATVFHMSVWYNNDFHPDSDTWKSMSMVRGMHNSASKRACNAGLTRISQKDMAVTQFGFMGFVLSRAERVGIHNASEEDLEAFVHLWRVVGHLLGMEERFNLCTGTVEETRELCNLLIEKILVPEICKQEPDFLKMSYALISGLWVFNPSLDFDGFMTYFYMITTENINNNNNCDILVKKIKDYKGSKVIQMKKAVEFLKYDLFRYFLNFLQILGLWLMAHFPFLVYYRYGYKTNNKVKIFHS